VQLQRVLTDRPDVERQMGTDLPPDGGIEAWAVVGSTVFILFCVHGLGECEIFDSGKVLTASDKFRCFPGQVPRRPTERLYSVTSIVSAPARAPADRQVDRLRSADINVRRISPFWPILRRSWYPLFGHPRLLPIYRGTGWAGILDKILSLHARPHPVRHIRIGSVHARNSRCRALVFATSGNSNRLRQHRRWTRRGYLPNHAEQAIRFLDIPEHDPGRRGDERAPHVAGAVLPESEIATQDATTMAVAQGAVQGDAVPHARPGIRNGHDEVSRSAVRQLIRQLVRPLLQCTPSRIFQQPRPDLAVVRCDHPSGRFDDRTRDVRITGRPVWRIPDLHLLRRLLRSDRARLLDGLAHACARRRYWPVPLWAGQWSLDLARPHGVRSDQPRQRIGDASGDDMDSVWVHAPSRASHWWPYVILYRRGGHR
jgi:hypothetical protein